MLWDDHDEYQYGHGMTKLFPEQGYNAAIIAYGQTGTGKTYTMEGEQHGPERGIIPRAVEDVFAYIENDTAPGSKYLVRASYLQIYNEVPLPQSLSKCACTHKHSDQSSQQDHIFAPVFLKCLIAWDL